MCSMLREPRLDDRKTRTAVAPDFVLTVRTYGTSPLYGPLLARKFTCEKLGNSKSARRDPQIREREPSQVVGRMTPSYREGHG